MHVSPSRCVILMTSHLLIARAPAPFIARCEQKVCRSFDTRDDPVRSHFASGSPRACTRHGTPRTDSAGASPGGFQRVTRFDLVRRTVSLFEPRSRPPK
jgi:hypothetical protein